jgi:hypothetical protein
MRSAIVAILVVVLMAIAVGPPIAAAAVQQQSNSVGGTCAPALERRTSHARFIIRWSTRATTSPFWLVSVERTTTNIIVPVRPVFS